MPFVYDAHAPAVAIEGFGAAARPTNDPCGSWPAKTSTMSSLQPMFRKSLERLMAMMRTQGVPFYVSETLRSHDRQCRAMCEGGSQVKSPNASAHTYGLAADVQIQNPGVKLYTSGLNKPHTEVTNVLAYSYFAALGSTIATHFPELEWGGEWKNSISKRYGIPKSQILYGFDPWHIQWRKHYKYRPAGEWKCASGNKAERITAPGEIAKAKISRALEETPGKVGTPVIVAGAVLAWWLWNRRKKR